MRAPAGRSRMIYISEMEIYLIMNQNSSAPRLILASGSPRRRELLAKMGYTFEICVPDVDEHAVGHVRDIVAALSQRKARAAAEHYCEGTVIASDTLVSYQGAPLGKPEDAADAFRMLKMLSGNTHEVFTGVTLLDAASGRALTRVVRTGVTFRPLTDVEIDAYIATGEPMDKAGAYGIQGGAGKFVVQLDGSFENVMGFPVDDIQDMLSNFSNEAQQEAT